MQQIRLDSKDGLANGWAGAGVSDARNLPERARAKSAPAANVHEAADEQTTKRSWVSATFRFARNAMAGLLLLTAVPVAIVGWRSQHLRYYDHTFSDQRIELVERLRPLMAAKDASITPMQAGLAFHALQGTPKSDEFPMVASSPSAEWPWRTHKPSADMFKSTGAPMRLFNGPSPEHIIERVSAGFSANELAYLREIAEAPVWKDFDLVASANAVDIIGGQYQLPFKESAFLPAMPSWRFAGTKELAYASTSRAAYYLAIGQPAKAETVLRSTISFGFAMIDNASSTMDGLIGAVVANIGRGGLAQLYDATHVTNALVADVPMPTRQSSDPLRFGQKLSVAELQQRYLLEAGDPALPRAVRMEQLSQASYSSCRSIPGMIFGPNAATRTAFDNASKTLARFPSEQALLDLMLEATNRVPDKEIINVAPERFVMGAALIASKITNNPRFSTCTRLAISYW
ncbi:MAG: hypothetical protein ABJB74_02930 [Gemmatimonas sp.]